MKLHWLLPGTFGSILMLSSPTLAAQLDSWRFDANQNRLEINTTGAVQPQAQLIFNPTRLVIDLPGTTFGRPQLRQQVGGAITSIRVGQFDQQTTRIVVELTPGYTLDPNQVKFVGTTASRWTVQIPTPVAEGVATQPTEIAVRQPTATSALPPRNIYNVVTTQPSTLAQATKPTAISATQGTTQIENFRITGDGFFVRTSGGNPQIQVNRSDDRRAINIDIAGASLSPSLSQRDVSINRYGVNRIQFSQLQTSPPVVRMTMQVDKNGSDWRASTSSVGGFIVLPNTGVVRLPGSSNIQLPGSSNPRPIPPPVVANLPATIQSVELAATGTQLIVRGDRNLSANGSWDRSTGFYRITIPNARLAPSVRGPVFGSNSPILKVRLQQQDSNTVAIFVQPTPGAQIGELNQVGDQFIALQIQPSRRVPTSSSISGLPLPPLPSPDRGPFPDPLTNDRPTSPLPSRRVPRGRTLVVIDPGHGGKDSGAPGLGGLLEKDVVLPISKRVAAILEQNGVQTVLTRDSDYFVELQGRVDIAARANASLFVSIHGNSVDRRPDVNGLEVYYYDSGYNLAEVVRKTILQNISTIKDRGTRKARFYVLRKSSMPSILVEVGYMSGREDNPRLATTEYQNRMAEAIARGVLRYLQR
ncbi:N-acetylmuramoyl-L-alanine amidase [Scytonema hofmannii FACHB-248]|uniref:N-acetylmuramoyl-L-alanine amidase n=1 Tax=Scytonema hofmannii FACHB-248 TaxID=1842502 RepID=A0ABR8GSG1_9CYAN|nr:MULTISPECIES: N-acetylmuramoyl-L-alanine amidase [Nostocales]MBD2605979.1 N-acetylmuramoyl-L-alanine amidase [Scytonema hofmannii FACHB-248]